MTRVLVTFGSKHGATAEIADAVAETLRSCGLDADSVGGRSTASGFPEQFRDRRDWDEIRAWALGIAAALPVNA